MFCNSGSLLKEHIYIKPTRQPLKPLKEIPIYRIE